MPFVSVHRRQNLVAVVHLCFTSSSTSINLRFRSIHLRHSASSSPSKPFVHPRCRQSPRFDSIHSTWTCAYINL
ncbi:hypothetical protein RHMOL_Rhmol13G0163400 [Rhododendron molle]|uniref:Uncharacterized protein n=1 Tax=Rhododendron molle TaxID=49168 RepID=A0ACC0L7A4_RHOML|nr:hypothetical protein RHMOL_Rhmol13G0163400 [Rhododendron molle]